MKTRQLILSLFFALFIACGVDFASALEFSPLIAKNTDNVSVSTGIVGEPIFFEYTVTNNEENLINFDVAFSIRTINDKILNFQTQHVGLESGETTTLTYQFIPETEGNYVSSINSIDPFISDAITFSALDKSKDYQTKTVTIYSDDDCSAVCSDPSVINIDVGTVVIWNNTTPDIRHISTGNYVEDKDGISWSSTDGFHSTIIPERESSFLFSQPGEYQLFLAEHRTQDVIGTVHVMSDQFREADKTFNILNKIMNDDEFGIPISSLHINPKNSVITVGINDKRNSLFTLDVYKTMLYKQVGNVYLNIISDHNSPKWCDVNDEVAVKSMLNKDPVVKQFLQSYPSATFEHFKTGDEPGNPRTYSEFRYGIFVLRVFVSTFDQNGTCYHVYGYAVEYDVPNSLVRSDVSKNIFSQSDDVSKAIQAVKSLTNPLQQYKMGIKYDGIQCKDGLELVGKMPYAHPKCVKPESLEKLAIRGWATTDKTLELTNPTKHTIEKNSNIFEINYSLNGATLQSIAYDADANSVHVTFDESIGGQMILSIPRDLLDAKMGSDNADDVFFLLIDGEENMYGEITTANERIITVWFPRGAHDIEIIGTFWI